MPSPWHHNVVLLQEAQVQQFPLPPALWAPQGPRAHVGGCKAALLTLCEAEGAEQEESKG